jgi:hypothetical protein
VLSKARGSALRAWLRILLNVLLLPWRHSAYLARRWRRRGALLARRSMWHAQRAVPLLALAVALYVLLTRALQL